jgi:hypothetical protein
MTCRHHEALVALHAEPVRTNPAKLIGYVCPDCLTLFTAHYLPSEPTVPTSPNVPNSPPCRNLAHAARLRAAERLGFLMRAAA